MKEYTQQEVEALLPPGEHMPVFRQDSVGGLVKSSMPAMDLKAMLTDHQAVEAGEHAKSMGYALAIEDEHGWLFIKTI